MKRLLYLEDLWKFYASQNKNVKFSSQDSDTTIVVHINEPFLFNEQTDDELNLYAPIRLCHIDKNANNSSISEKAMKEAMSTAYEMPLLAYIYPDPDNKEQYTFAGHEFYVDDNNEMVYEEAPVGVISTKQKLELVYDAESDKKYLDGLAKVWRTYTKAAEILEREKKFSVSVEIAVDDLSYSAKDKVLVINAFRFMGVTILGKSRTDGSEIKPGMTGSNISIEDFSEKNNSIFSQNDKVIEMLSALNEKIDNLNIDKNFRKEETMKKKLEEKSKDIKDTPSGVKFDDNDGEGIDYYEPEETEEATEPEVAGTSEENNDPPLTGNDDTPLEEVGEPSDEDVAAAEAATATINALSDSSSAADVAAARTEYDALSDEAKTLIEPEVYAKLEAQETRITNKEAADAVTVMITALSNSSSVEDIASARAAYEALTTDQKALITSQTLAILTTQEARIDGEAADVVTEMIDGLNDESSVAEVEAAREAYDALTETQKELISKETLDKLEEQEERVSNESVGNDDVPKKKRRNNNSLEIKYSVECKDGVKTHFSTLTEKLAALSDLVNITYGDTDDTYYFVDADEDKKLVYMHDAWRDKHYRQSYTVKKDNYSLKGDRCELFARYLSQDEINEFEKMKSNYSSTAEKLSQYESEPDKVKILESNDYAQIKNTKAYEELAKRETYFEMSKEELIDKLDKILLEYAKHNKLKFSATESEKKTVGMKLFGNPSNKSSKSVSRYGGLGKNDK